MLHVVYRFIVAKTISLQVWVLDAGRHMHTANIEKPREINIDSKK